MIENEEVNGTEQPSSVNKSAEAFLESKAMKEKNEEEIENAIEISDKEVSADAEPSVVEVEKVVLAEESKVEESKEKSEIEKGKEEEEEEPPKAKIEDKAALKEETKLVEKKSPAQQVDELAKEDFAKYTKEQFVELIKKLAKHDDPFYAERYLKQIEPLFSEIKKAELTEAKEAYIKANGNEEGFSFRVDELTNRFDANTRLIYDRKHAFSKDREAQRQANLKKAEETLEKLRFFVGSEESNASFNKFKAIQSEWKSIGDVPGSHSKTLWANFNALVNRFYDQRSIYFELKELDRKKNYEAKVKICEKAEALSGFENLKEAINTLNDYHYDYKHLGPVPQELQEDLWQRFKAASDKVYEKRKEFVSDLKVTLQENLAKKEEIVAVIKPFVDFTSDRIKEWNTKTKELLELQKNWEAIGGLPRDKSKEINKQFWSSFKTFFHNKGNFFKQLDAERKTNYEAKLALVEKAESLKESTDWFKTANDFKTLQQDWKAIGPVPEKFRNEVYAKFKAACDFFFNNKRTNSKDEEQSYKANLNRKKECIAHIKEWTAEADLHLEDFKKTTKEFVSIGFVPRKEIGTIKDRFATAVETFISALSADDEVKNTLRVEIEFGDLLGSKNAEKAIYGKEQNIRRQVQQLENDVALWKNNLEFFAHSKNADGLRKEVNEKIDKAEARVQTLKGQLKMLRLV